MNIRIGLLHGMLIFKVKGMFMCLFFSLGIFNHLSFLLEENALILKGLSSRERKFNLKESLSLGSDSSSP